MTKDAKQIQAGLAMPFAPEDLEWRLQQAFEDKNRGLAVPYVTNRAIQDRLDDVVGPENWHNEFRPWHGSGKKESQICGIAIYNEERKEWNTKWDGAEDTDVEAIKGGLSDSMKRAAVQWGIGRILYKMDVVWVNVEKRGRSWIIPDSERPRLDKAYLDLLKRLKLTPALPGGLRSELTPRPGAAPQPTKDTPKEPPKETGKETKKEKTLPAPQTAAPSKVVQLPTAPQPVREYTVLSAKKQTGMTGNATTSLTLRREDGNTLRAFFRGTDAGLTPGAELCCVKLTMKKQDTVVFYVLEGYEIMSGTPLAA